MKTKNILLITFIAILSFSCENNEIIDKDNLLLGNWVQPVYDGDITTYKRANTLPNKNSGIAFMQNGGFIERTSGWCGTPPLSYFNVEGSFSLDESLINITTQSYPSFYGWRILELTEKKLVVKRELSEQEKEHRALMVLFDEIQNLSYSESCSNSSNWTFTAYGSKACGGPQGFIAYSKNIDTAAFLQKIDAYTKAEKEFNIKWGVVSNCAIVNPPKSVECKNGYPILNY